MSPRYRQHRTFAPRAVAKVSAFDWEQALLRSVRLAELAADEPTGCMAAFQDELMMLRAVVTDLEAGQFPLLSLPARQMASGWIGFARAFCNPELAPEARTACAPIVAAAARHLGDLVSAWRAAQARPAMRVTGERLDD